MIEMLLAHKDIKVNERDAKNRTSVSLAARHGHEDVLRLLLKHDGIDDMSLLMHASRRGHAKIVRLLLLFRRSSINEQDNFGETSLIIAVRHDHREVVPILLDSTPTLVWKIIAPRPH